MNEDLFLIVPLLTGVVIGSIFFGGLWLTIKKGMLSKTPSLWFLGSFILRTGIATGNFFLLLRGGIGLVALLVCLVLLPADLSLSALAGLKKKK